MEEPATAEDVKKALDELLATVDDMSRTVSAEIMERIREIPPDVSTRGHAKDVHEALAEFEAAGNRWDQRTFAALCQNAVDVLSKQHEYAAGKLHQLLRAISVIGEHGLSVPGVETYAKQYSDNEVAPYLVRSNVLFRLKMVHAELMRFHPEGGLAKALSSKTRHYWFDTAKNAISAVRSYTGDLSEMADRVSSRDRLVACCKTLSQLAGKARDQFLDVYCLYSQSQPSQQSLLDPYVRP